MTVKLQIFNKSEVCVQIQRQKFSGEPAQVISQLETIVSEINSKIKGASSFGFQDGSRLVSRMVRQKTSIEKVIRKINRDAL